MLGLVGARDSVWPKTDGHAPELPFPMRADSLVPCDAVQIGVQIGAVVGQATKESGEKGAT